MIHLLSGMGAKASSESASVVRVVLPSGEVKTQYAVVSAQEILRCHPCHTLTRYDVLTARHYPVRPKSMLEPGMIYCVVRHAVVPKLVNQEPCLQNVMAAGASSDAPCPGRGTVARPPAAVKQRKAMVFAIKHYRKHVGLPRVKGCVVARSPASNARYAERLSRARTKVYHKVSTGSGQGSIRLIDVHSGMSDMPGDMAFERAFAKNVEVAMLKHERAFSCCASHPLPHPGGEVPNSLLLVKPGLQGENQTQTQVTLGNYLLPEEKSSEDGSSAESINSSHDAVGGPSPPHGHALHDQLNNSPPTLYHSEGNIGSPLSRRFTQSGEDVPLALAFQAGLKNAESKASSNLIKELQVDILDLETKSCPVSDAISKEKAPGTCLLGTCKARQEEGISRSLLSEEEISEEGHTHYQERGPPSSVLSDNGAHQVVKATIIKDMELGSVDARANQEQELQGRALLCDTRVREFGLVTSSNEEFLHTCQRRTLAAHLSHLQPSAGQHDCEVTPSVLLDGIKQDSKSCTLSSLICHEMKSHNTSSHMNNIGRNQQNLAILGFGELRTDNPSIIEQLRSHKKADRVGAHLCVVHLTAVKSKEEHPKQQQQPPPRRRKPQLQHCQEEHPLLPLSNPVPQVSSSTVGRTNPQPSLSRPFRLRKFRNLYRRRIWKPLSPIVEISPEV